jgi:hypothetical protein
VKEIFEESIKVIFGADYDEVGEDGLERTISFKTYLEQRTKKAISDRKRAIERAKLAKFHSSKPK